VYWLWYAAGVTGGSVALGVYDHPPPDGSGVQAVEMDSADMFGFDARLVKGAAQATAYLEELRAWAGDLIP